MPEFKVHNLWPVPLYEGHLPVKKEWKDSISKLKYERTHVNNSWITNDRYVLNKMPDLREEIINHFNLFNNQFLKIEKSANFYLQNSWVNIHDPGDESQIHYHSNALISGVYYPIVPKNSGGITFLKGQWFTNLFHSNIRLGFEEYNHITGDAYKVDVNEGTIIFFPSHIDHKVQINKSNEKRYSLAFNFYVRGKFGREEYELELK